MQVNYEPWVIRNDAGEVWGVKILDGEFAGTALSINELDEKDGSKELILDYTVVQPPDGMTVEQVAGNNFDAILNFIISDILQKAVDEYENRKGNTSESSE